jgi:hypothetical protein
MECDEERQDGDAEAGRSAQFAESTVDWPMTNMDYSM